VCACVCVCLVCKCKDKAIPVQAYYIPIGFRKSQGSQISRHEGDKVVSPMHQLPLQPQEIFLILISVRDWIHRRAIVWLGRIRSIKNLSDTIEVFQLVAQCLNQLHLCMPPCIMFTYWNPTCAKFNLQWTFSFSNLTDA